MKSLLFSFVLFISISIYSQNLPSFKVIRYDSSYILKGYYFMTSKDNMIVLDKDVNIVYYKPVKEVLDFTLEKNAKMYFSNKEGLNVMDSTFHVIDSFSCKNGVRYDPHDRLILPNGHLVLMGSEKVKIDLKVFPEWKKKCSNDTTGVVVSVLQEQDAQRNVVWEWHAKDHFAFVEADSFFDIHFSPPQWTHSNALTIDADGNYIMSSRNFDEITKINHLDGSVMWRLGGICNEFKLVNYTVPFYGQHNIRRIANGHFTLLDNGENTVKHGARALEFELDEVKKTATLKWSYTFDPNVTSTSRGSVQRLPDGNTLISYGITSGADLCFVVVDSSGTKKFQADYFHPNNFKVINYPSLPFQLHRPVISCFDSAGVKYLDAGSGYNSYKWNTGDSTRIIALKSSGSYSVFVPYGGAGGHISSEKYIVSDILKPCNLKSFKGRNKKSNGAGDKNN